MNFLLSLANGGLNAVGTGVFLYGAYLIAEKGDLTGGVILLVAGLLVLAAYEYLPSKKTSP